MQILAIDIIPASMDIKDNSLALLPNGFVDLLPPFAESEALSIQVLMDKFASFGYSRIKPPLLEFEDSLLGDGLGKHFMSDTFRLMDPISHRMLGIRSDSTAQVSRIVSSRLENAPRPLRLTYANDVLRTRGSQIRTERQFTQVGCELIGGDNFVQSDAEICVLAVLGLKELGIDNITLDLTIPRFVSYLLNDVDDKNTIEKAVGQRDRDILLEHGSPQAILIAQAISVSGSYDNAITTLKELAFDDYLQGCITHLSEVCKIVVSALNDLDIDDVSLTIDLLEQVGFEHHDGLGFTIFARGLHGELGRGGSYDLEDSEIARGFTLYMDSVLKAIEQISDKKYVLVPYIEPWDVISRLQDQGWVVVRGVAPSGCSHIYKNGTIEELKSEELS